MKNRKNIGYGILFILAFALALFWLKPDKVENKVEVKTQKENIQKVVSDVLSKKIESQKQNQDQESSKDLKSKEDNKASEGNELCDEKCLEKKYLGRSVKIGEPVIYSEEERNFHIRRFNKYRNKKMKEFDITLSKDIPQDFIDEKGLPEDPGSENDKTIEGIDSNGNEIRDDLERAIAYNLKEYPEIVPLYNAAVIIQKRLNESNLTDVDIEEYKRNLVDYVECDIFLEDSGKKSFIPQLGLLEMNTWDRDERDAEISIAIGEWQRNLPEEQDPYSPENIDGEFCKNFIQKFGQ